MARQYSGTLGNVGNCEVAVNVHAATDVASAPLDWRLYLPESWDDDAAHDPEIATAITARRQRSAIPDDEHHRTKSAMALEMLDELISWGWTPPVIIAGDGDSATFRQRLTDRDLVYVVDVKCATLAHPADAAPTAAMRSRFVEMRVRPGNPNLDRAAPFDASTGTPSGVCARDRTRTLVPGRYGP